jgi:hypothetical protein
MLINDERTAVSKPRGPKKHRGRAV